jgi:hypothetical protein
MEFVMDLGVPVFLPFIPDQSFNMEPQVRGRNWEISNPVQGKGSFVKAVSALVPINAHMGGAPD